MLSEYDALGRKTLGNVKQDETKCTSDDIHTLQNSHLKWHTLSITMQADYRLANLTCTPTSML